jgi:hypothetical protein
MEQDEAWAVDNHYVQARNPYQTTSRRTGAICCSQQLALAEAVGPGGAIYNQIFIYS